MSIVFQEPPISRYIFTTIARFVDKVRFEIGEEALRIKSIDPHDFCYVDLLLLKNFFRSYNITKNQSFSVDISKFRSFLPKISKATQILLNVNNDSIDLVATKNWKMTFRIGFLETDLYNLPEPNKIEYETFAVINAEELSKLVDTGAAISSELIFSIEDKDFIVKSQTGEYSFIGKPSKLLKLKEVNRRIEVSAIASYFASLSPLIRRCDQVQVHLGEGKPIRLDLIYRNKAIFTFVLSHRRRQRRKTVYESREGASLPRLTISKLPEYLLYLSNCPEGETMRRLVSAGLETTGGDYGRMVIKLNLANRSKGKIQITKNGEFFVNLLHNDPKYSKQFLHTLVSAKVDAYNTLLDCLKEKPLAPNEVFAEINRNLREEGKYGIDRQDLSTLLGLAIWCEVVDKKLALYYLKNDEK